MYKRINDNFNYFPWLYTCTKKSHKEWNSIKIAFYSNNFTLSSTFLNSHHKDNRNLNYTDNLLYICRKDWYNWHEISILYIFGFVIYCHLFHPSVSREFNSDYGFCGFNRINWTIWKQITMYSLISKLTHNDIWYITWNFITFFNIKWEYIEHAR